MRQLLFLCLSHKWHTSGQLVDQLLGAADGQAVVGHVRGFGLGGFEGEIVVVVAGLGHLGEIDHNQLGKVGLVELLAEVPDFFPVSFQNGDGNLDDS